MQTTTKIVSSIFIFLLITGAAVYAAPQISIGINHTASTLAIPGQGGGNGGGGSGGGGVTSDEPYGNIAKADRMEKSLIANQPVSYTFTAPELSIYQIDVTGKENENDVMVRVELLNQRSQKILSSPPGAVYKYVNIFLSTKRITGAIIKFKVENIVQNPGLFRWDGKAWLLLGAVETGKDSAFTYYSANTEGFSSFAIVGRPLSAPSEEEVTVLPNPFPTGSEAPSQQPVTETPESVPQAKTTPWIGILLGGILAVIVIVVLWRKYGTKQ